MNQNHDSQHCIRRLRISGDYRAENPVIRESRQTPIPEPGPVYTGSNCAYEVVCWAGNKSIIRYTGV